MMHTQNKAHITTEATTAVIIVAILEVDSYFLVVTDVVFLGYSYGILT